MKRILFFVTLLGGTLLASAQKTGTAKVPFITLSNGGRDAAIWFRYFPHP